MQQSHINQVNLCLKLIMLVTVKNEIVGLVNNNVIGSFIHLIDKI